MLYLLAAFSIYVFSFLAGFSIGQFTVGFTFVFIVLAIGYSFKLIKTRLHATIFVLIGLIVWIIAVLFVDDGWLFSAFRF